MAYLETYESWLNNPLIDEATKEELRDLRKLPDGEKEIEDRFYRNLSFGTGGLRGTLGAGTNRMNVYTVSLATQGLANYILRVTADDDGQTPHPTPDGRIGRGVVIGYDSRLFSPEFANAAANVLNANGIETYIFPSLRPTPEISYAVRKLHCIAGIVITASHNPREYNGYKVYFEDGAQITPPHDKNILAEVAKVTELSQVKGIDTLGTVLTVPQGADADGKSPLYHVIPDTLDDDYLAAVKKESVHPEVISEMAKDFTIVYTPLNGTGNVPVRRVLRELGFEKVHIVKEQEAPDGNFPTLPFPNPEVPAAFDLALKLAKEVDADIVLATDPDADRLGVYGKDGNGGYVPFTGNMAGVLIEEYLLCERGKKGTMPQNPVVADTIVTTDMANVVAKDYNVRLVETLTGFKYIGEQIKFYSQDTSENPPTFVFGLEESYGCLAGTYTRDKDAVVAVMLLCEVAAWNKKQGKTLWDAMLSLYEKYGYFREGQKSITLKGADGAEKMKTLMENARNNPPKELAGMKVVAVRDYQNDTRTELESGATAPTGLPKSNVLYYELENDGWCAIRPSGTEPKIKFYYGVKGASLSEGEEKLVALGDVLVKMYQI